MKTKILALCTLLLVAVAHISAKDHNKHKDTVTYLVSMTCEKCQKRIESNIPFEKGVTDLKVDLPKKLVTIEYRTDKTNPEKLKNALKEMGYTVTPFQLLNQKSGNKENRKQK